MYFLIESREKLSSIFVGMHTNAASMIQIVRFKNSRLQGSLPAIRTSIRPARRRGDAIKPFDRRGVAVGITGAILGLIPDILRNSDIAIHTCTNPNLRSFPMHLSCLITNGCLFLHCTYDSFHTSSRFIDNVISLRFLSRVISPDKSPIHPSSIIESIHPFIHPCMDSWIHRIMDDTHLRLPTVVDPNLV